MKQITLSVVIPCFEEMANLRKGVLNRVIHYLKKQPFNYEVIIADDGSKDGSLRFIKGFAKEYSEIRIIENEHLGKAGAVTKGILASKGLYVLFTDMDQATPIEELSKLMPFLKQGFDVVIGSRNTKREGAPISRLVISRSNIILRKLLVGLSDITDTQCGFKLFSNEAAHKIFSAINEHHNGFKKISASAVKAGFDVEILLIARNSGYKIKEVPVNWLYVESRRVSPIRDSLEGVHELLNIRMNIFKGKYN